MKKLLALTVCFTLSPLAYAATLTSMSASEVKSTISGKTIKTVSAATLNGKLIENSFIGYFSADGKITGSFERKPADASLTDTGVWNVKPNGDFCFTWDHWDNHAERCVQFYKLVDAILVTSNGNKFETVILNSNIRPGDQTSSMMTVTTPSDTDTTPATNINTPTVTTPNNNDTSPSTNMSTPTT